MAYKMTQSVCGYFCEDIDIDMLKRCKNSVEYLRKGATNLSCFRPFL